MNRKVIADDVYQGMWRVDGDGFDNRFTSKEAAEHYADSRNPNAYPMRETSIQVIQLRNEYWQMEEQREQVENSTLNALYEMKKRATEITFAELGLDLGTREEHKERKERCHGDKPERNLNEKEYILIGTTTTSELIGYVAALPGVITVENRGDEHRLFVIKKHDYEWGPIDFWVRKLIEAKEHEETDSDALKCFWCNKPIEKRQVGEERGVWAHISGSICCEGNDYKTANPRVNTGTVKL